MPPNASHAIVPLICLAWRRRSKAFFVVVLVPVKVSLWFACGEVGREAVRDDQAVRQEPHD